MLIITILIFIGLLLALVLVHEFGHLMAAKRAGCKVEEFGFGFPPRLFSWTYKDTIYSFNLFPIGGFVKIEGEDMDETKSGPTSFATKSATWRIVILAAGVTMNVVLAAVLLSFQAGIGFPTLATDTNTSELTDIKAYITEVVPNSPASLAGIQALDRIVQVEATANPTPADLQALVADKAGQEVTIEIERQGQHQTLQLTPRVNPPEGEGALGVQLVATGLQKVAWWKAPFVGIQRTFQMLAAIVVQFWQVLGRLINSGTVGETLTGPIGIAMYAQEATQLGVSYLLEFAALISLNLALINILPLPALDGGRIMFVLVEKIRGRRLAAKFEQVTHTVGFVLLLGLMLAITWRDVHRFFF